MPQNKNYNKIEKKIIALNTQSSKQVQFDFKFQLDIVKYLQK